MRAYLSTWLERFRGSQKDEERGPLSMQSSLSALMFLLEQREEGEQSSLALFSCKYSKVLTTNSAQFIVPDWGDQDDYGIGLLYCKSPYNAMPYSTLSPKAYKFGYSSLHNKIFTLWEVLHGKDRRPTRHSPFALSYPNRTNKNTRTFLHMQIRICKLHEEKVSLTQQRNLFPVRLFRERDKKGI
jgi:hypothetical protein